MNVPRNSISHSSHCLPESDGSNCVCGATFRYLFGEPVGLALPWSDRRTQVLIDCILAGCDPGTTGRSWIEKAWAARPGHRKVGDCTLFRGEPAVIIARTCETSGFILQPRNSQVVLGSTEVTYRVYIPRLDLYETVYDSSDLTDSPEAS